MALQRITMQGSMEPRQLAAMKRSNGTKARWAVDSTMPDPKKVRSYDHEIILNIGKRTRRGFNGCKLSHEKRLAILVHHENREKFFASV